MLPRQLQVLFIAACIVVVGCSAKPTPVPVATPAPAPALSEGTPATADDCKDFGTQLEKAVAGKDRARLNQLLSIEDLAMRCVSDIGLPANDKASLTQGVQKGARNNSLVTQILAEVEKGGTYKLLRVHDVDGRPRVLLRIISPDNGVNYHDFVLVKYSDGRVGVEDVYIFATGEMLSQSLRRLLLPAAAELNRGIVAQLRGSDKIYYDNMLKAQSIGKAIAAGDGRKAVTIYKSLPAELRDNKVYLLAYVRAAGMVDEAEYATALATYRKIFPMDAAIDFLSIDYFLLKEQYDDALRSLATVEKSVGGDPYLHVLRGNLLVAAKRFKEARTETELAIKEEPSMQDAYWGRIGVALKEKNHKDTLAWLKKLVEKTDEEVADLTTIADYADFVKSPEHKTWVAWYGGRKK